MFANKIMKKYNVNTYHKKGLTRTQLHSTSIVLDKEKNISPTENNMLGKHNSSTQ